MSQNKKSGPSEKKSSSLGNPISRFFSSIFKKLGEWTSNFKNWVSSFFSKTKKSDPTETQPQSAAPATNIPAPATNIPAPATNIPAPADMPASQPPKFEVGDREKRISNWKDRIAAHNATQLESIIMNAMISAMNILTTGAETNFRKTFDTLENILNKKPDSKTPHAITESVADLCALMEDHLISKRKTWK